MLRKEQLQAIKDCPTTPDCIACIFYEKHGCSSGRPEDLAETALELMAEVEQLIKQVKDSQTALETLTTAHLNLINATRGHNPADVAEIETFKDAAKGTEVIVKFMQNEITAKDKHIEQLQEVLKQAKECIQLGVNIMEGNSPDWTIDLMHWAYNDGMAAIDLIDKIGGGKDE